MARKAKKKVHAMPKLGWQDMLLYWTAMIGCGIGFLVCLFLPGVTREQAALESVNMVAFTAGATSNDCFWLCVWFFVILLIIIIGPYQGRRPIFGRSDIRYGPPAYPRVYPLLMKDKPYHWVSPKQQALKKKLYTVGAVVLVVTLLFSAVMFRQSLVARNELNRNGTISVFDCQNQETAYYSQGDIRSIRLDTHTTGGRHRKSWTFSIWLTTGGGETFQFSLNNFTVSKEEALGTMIALKERYRGFVTVEGTDKLDRVISDRKLNETEISLLYELFEIE